MTTVDIDTVPHDRLTANDLTRLRELFDAEYESCGWSRVSAVEHSIDRAGQPVVQTPGPPLLTLALDPKPRSWPAGPIDLRGRAW